MIILPLLRLCKSQNFYEWNSTFSDYFMKISALIQFRIFYLSHKRINFVLKLTCLLKGSNASENYSNQSLQWKTQQDARVYQNFIIPYFKWSLTCFGRHTAYHQEPKLYKQPLVLHNTVEGCRTSHRTVKAAKFLEFWAEHLIMTNIPISLISNFRRVLYVVFSSG